MGIELRWRHDHARDIGSHVTASWRSLLFVPAHLQRFVAKAHERGADGVILDLEDAVPPDQKQAARAALPSAIFGLSRHGTAALVRVNHGIRQLARDLEAAVVPGLSGLVLPKVEDAGYVREVAAAVGELEMERALPAGSVRLVLQIETPAALFDLMAIASAHPRCAAMTLGPEDFSAAMGGTPNDALLLGPNLAVLAAARSCGLQPLGYVGGIGDYSDLADYRSRVEQARSLGFRGAMAIHPAQVAILNQAFAPTEAEVAWAERVCTAAAAAQHAGHFAFQLDGRMIDPPIVRRAQDILAETRPPIRDV